MTLHLIYGIACAGKSTTALRLAADNGVRTIISTDYLREVQRLYVPAAQSPVLAKVSHTAWELSGDPTPGGIIAGFTSHAEAVFPAVEAVAANGQDVNLFLQDDWHVRVFASDGTVRHSTELKPGDALLGHLPTADRHVGYAIDEFCLEM